MWYYLCSVAPRSYTCIRNETHFPQSLTSLLSQLGFASSAFLWLLSLSTICAGPCHTSSHSSDAEMTTDSVLMCPSGPLKGSALSDVIHAVGVSLSNTTLITGAPPSTAGKVFGTVIVLGILNPPIAIKDVQAACTHLKSGGQLALIVPTSQVRHLAGMISIEHGQAVT